jgi:hypothetical protein
MVSLSTLMSNSLSCTTQYCYKKVLDIHIMVVITITTQMALPKFRLNWLQFSLVAVCVIELAALTSTGELTTNPLTNQPIIWEYKNAGKYLTYIKHITTHECINKHVHIEKKKIAMTQVSGFFKTSYSESLILCTQILCFTRFYARFVWSQPKAHQTIKF